MQSTDYDGTSFVWNIMPSSKSLTLKTLIPQAVHYTFKSPSSILVNATVLRCSRCQAVFNPYCRYEENLRQVYCCFCGHYTNVKEKFKELPESFLPQYSTVEYWSKLNNSASVQFNLLFVVDATVEQKQFTAIKSALVRLVEGLQDDARVGLVSFGNNVLVHDFQAKVSTAICFAGDQAYKLTKMADNLGLRINDRGVALEMFQKYLVRVGEQRAKVMKRINTIKRMVRQTYTNERQQRATGQALYIALSLLQISPQSGRAVLLVGGPCTLGQGQVIPLPFSKQLHEPNQYTSLQQQQAIQFYSTLQRSLLAKKNQLDLFVMSVQQIGLVELHQLVVSSGGLLVQHEEFDSDIFSQSFQRAYRVAEEYDVVGGVEAVTMIVCSKEVVVNGLLSMGVAYPVNRERFDEFGISDKEIGKGCTNAWYIGHVNEHRTGTFMLSLREQQARQQAFYIQFQTVYKNPLKADWRILRVTTVRRAFDSSLGRIATGFNQQGAIALLARLCIGKANCRQWLDDLLCKLSIHFSTYTPNQQASFCLPEQMKSLPQFIYHLRRNLLVRKTGCSKDELCYLEHIVCHETVQHVLTIIQPALLSYSIDCPQPTSRSLDAKYMSENVILVLDSYFNVVEWHGETIRAWIDAKYHQMKEYAHVTELVESPRQDIEYLMSSRFPTPVYYLTHRNHSKQRFLKSKMSIEAAQCTSDTILTDDVDLGTFTRHLINLVVATK